MKTPIKTAALAAVLSLASLPALAGDNAIGTGALALAVGIHNLYYQGRINDKSAFTLEVASVSDFDYDNASSPIDATGVGASYKYYFSDYMDGGYFKAGLANLNVSSGDDSVAGVIPIILGGFESRAGDNFVMGIEVGIGTTAGFGLLSFNLGATF